MSVARSLRMRERKIRSKPARDSMYRYESPLNVFKKSLEELTSIVDKIVCKRDGRLSRGMAQRLSKQNAIGTSSRESSPQNSVIVINDSDSDSETTDGDNNNETNVGGEEDTSLSVIECISKPSSSIRQKRKSRISTKQNMNKSVILLDNDSSVLNLPDMQESLSNGENIAPTQTEDDVIELWSCLKKSNVNRRKKNVKYNCGGTNTMFTIDKRPNMKYLKCLRTDAKYPEKRKKKQDLSCSKATLEPVQKIHYPTLESIKLVKQKSLKCLNSNQTKRQRDNNLDPSPKKSNANHSIKRLKLDEKNNKINSTHKLREIVVDGCNVAMAHTNGKEFSEKGIQIVVDYFKLRGHVVKVFLPQHVRKKEHIFLEKLYKEGTVVFTPSRTIDGRQITSYDDRYILKYATSCGGIVISTDQYRDLYKEKPEWRNTILNRLLMPTFVGDYIMFPDDPLGRFGPNLETFLRH